MKIAITADLHLTEYPEDRYRWQVFENIIKDAFENQKAKEIWILGDIFDRRTQIPMAVGEKIREFLGEKPAKILLGNHDPLSGMALAKSKNIKIQIPGDHEEEFIPWQENPEDIPVPHGKTIFTHYRISGVNTQSGPAKFDSVQERKIQKLFKNTRKIISGDIHDEQVFKDEKTNTYWHFVGAPVHLNFGDTNQPCYMIYDREKDTQERILLPPHLSPRKIKKHLESREDILEFLKTADVNNIYLLSVSKKITDYQKKRIEKKFQAKFQ